MALGCDCVALGCDCVAFRVCLCGLVVKALDCGVRGHRFESHQLHLGRVFTPRAHARSGVKQSVLSVSQSVSQSVSLSCEKN